MEIHRAARVLAFLGICLCASAQDPLVLREDLRSLERMATELARAGREELWRELIAVLADLGMPSKELGALRQTGETALARVKKPAADVSRIGKGIRDAVSVLSKRLDSLEAGERKQQLAQLLLRLDSSSPGPNQALGHENLDGAWVVAGATKRSGQRNAIARALQDARHLEVPMAVSEVEASDVRSGQVPASMMARLLGRKFVSVRIGDMETHSALSAEQTVRIVKQAVRAAAVANFVIEGKLDVPRPPKSCYLLLDSKSDYDRAIKVAFEGGWIDEMTAERAHMLGGFYFKDLSMVIFGRTEAEHESVLLYKMDEFRLSQPTLTAGHINWVCKAYLGTSIPLLTVETVSVRNGAPGGTASGGRAQQAEREEMFRLANAGIAGSRALIRYLAANREDPAWSQSMKAQIGEIQGIDLLKSMHVAEFLMEERSLKQIDQLLRKDLSSALLSTKFETALGMPLEEFESLWRRWLIGVPDGLANRMQHKGALVPKDVGTALEKLNALRSQAFQGAAAWVTPRSPVGFDPELSSGCIAHAAYLAQHPEMAARWPDAHEENPDHADWSASGAWAGGHSVIAPGSGDFLEAIESWMGTFYHRLPLIDPGLLRIGLGASGKVVVMDSGSMVETVSNTWHVGWPADGAVNVPTRFVPELPNPVPGEDQSQFGYPITLQLGVREDGSQAEVEMRLLRNDEAVPCWFSTPQIPTYVELAPAGAYCLIPKGHLRPGTSYVVEAKLIREQKLLTWTFRTSAR